MVPGIFSLTWKGSVETSRTSLPLSSEREEHQWRRGGGRVMEPGLGCGRL